MTNKTALITGGAGGLGSEVVRALHGCGYRVALNYCTSEPEARLLAEELGETVALFRADVSSAEEASVMARAIHEKWGRLDAVIHAAGIAQDSLLIKQKEEEWDRIIAVNLKGAFNVLRASIPLMEEGGHIIMLSSYSGLKGKEGQAAYSASKAALLGLTKTAALELAAHYIRVNAVLPGYMATKMGMAAPAAMNAAQEASILHSLSDPRDVANFILYLITTSHVTGQIFCLESRIV